MKTTAGQTTTYGYDTLGNLITVTQPTGTVITYTVDGRGRRVRKSIDGTPVQGWLYADQLRPIAELDGSGAIVSRFVYGTKPNVPEYVVKAGETYRIVSDHLGTPRVVVHATTGAIVQRFDVQAFGEPMVDTNPGWQPFGFAGGLYDPDTGLVRFGARDYDPQAGRWTAKDPIGFRGGSTGLYRYAYGDPANWRDADGQVVLSVVGGVAGAISGAVSGYVGSGGRFRPTVIGALSGGALGIVNPAGGVGGLFVSGFLSSVVEQAAENWLTCRSLADVDVQLAATSGVGSVIGNGIGRYLASPTRSAFSYEMMRRYGREPVSFVEASVGLVEGAVVGLSEVAYGSPTSSSR
jgi:RHS repeat-associated protein